MERYREEFVLEQDLMDIIASYMDDDMREQVHAELAPCTPEKFLKRYCELDENFVQLLKSEFDIKL